MAAFGTYYFRNKKRNRKQALLCKALATAVPENSAAGISVRNVYRRICRQHRVRMGGWRDLAGSICGHPCGNRILYGGGCTAGVQIRMGSSQLWLRTYMHGGRFSFERGDGTGLEEKRGLFRRRRSAWPDTGWSVRFFVAAAWAALHRYFHSLKKKKLLYPLLGLCAGAEYDGCSCRDGRRKLFRRRADFALLSRMCSLAETGWESTGARCAARWY